MIHFGIIGCGLMGQRQALELQEPWFQPLAAVTGVYDQDHSRAAALAEQLGATACDSLEAICNPELVDAVYIATPDPAHKEPFIAAVESGVAVLVEKPFATTVEDARQMLEASRDAKQVIEVNWGNRWQIPFIELKDAIENGELGHVRGTKAWLSNTTEVPLSMLSWASQSSSAWFLLSHVFDVATWLSGARPTRVHAHGTKEVLVKAGVDTYDYLHALVEYDDGSSGIYESSWIMPKGLGRLVDFQFHVLGTQGSASIDLGHQMIEVAGPEQTSWRRGVSYARDRMFSFLGACETGGGDAHSSQSGFDNTATLVALHQSVESGEIVEVARS